MARLKGAVLPEKHLVILGIRGVPAQHGGFESFAERLVPWMVEAGWRVTVYCQGSPTGERYEDTWEGCQRIHIPVHGDTAVSTIEFDIKSTIDAVRKNAIILTLGYNTGFLSAFIRMRGRFNLINMDGIEWRRAKYTKMQKAYLWVNERLAAAFGNVLIADHPEIAKHHAKHVFSDKIRTIPYGGDPVYDADESILAQYGLTPGGFMTVIARPEPENSLLEIVRAYSRRPRGKKLVVLGNYRRKHPYQASVLDSAGDEVIFPGAIYNKSHLRALRYFSLAYIHGHQVGGTNPSLVEALGAGNAIIAHDNPYNRWVAGDAGLWFSSPDEASVHIDLIISDEAAQQRLSAKARKRWEEVFTWHEVLKAYQACLESV